jgi:hypothetical protein
VGITCQRTRLSRGGKTMHVTLWPASFSCAIEGQSPSKLDVTLRRRLADRPCICRCGCGSSDTRLCPTCRYPGRRIPSGSTRCRSLALFSTVEWDLTQQEKNSPQVNAGFICMQRDCFGLVRKALDAVDVGANPVRHGCFGWGGL